MSDVRVWAEEREGNDTLLTWAWPEDIAPTRDHDADARTVAATLGVIDGVLSAEPSGEGVSVTYDPDKTDRKALAEALRSALALEDDLKTRVNDLLRRLPKYAQLAAAIALDERMSPAPEIARQAAATRASGPATAARMVPGLALVTRIHAIIPMLRGLSQWSRTASPEDVEAHFVKSGLSRTQLDRDLATAHEAIASAKAQAAATTAKAAAKATQIAGQTRERAREWLRQAQAARERESGADEERPG